MTTTEDELRSRLRAVTTELADTRRRLDDIDRQSCEPIAVVGMACRFPGGLNSPEAVWELVNSGADTVGGLPPDRGWSLADVGLSVSPQGSFLAGATGFDAEFFGISPREALAMDPQQRLMLEVTQEVLERAGIPPDTVRGSATGVFVGAFWPGYFHPGTAVPDDSAMHIGTGVASSVTSGRISYTFGWEGPAMTIDTACSSSLVAVHQAIRSMRCGECDLAVAGGGTVMSTPTAVTSAVAAPTSAPDGRCKSFADDADGMGWGEGMGAVLLERLSDARRRGHPVLAVIRGSAVNQDGASYGLTAPNGRAQQRVIRAALADARTNPADVDLVEAHGTGTKRGDPIEAHALLATYGRAHTPRRPLWLGSIKSNLGHTQAAAGLAGLIKVVMAIRHGVLPATLHVDEPSSRIDWSSGTLELLTEPRAWDGGAERVGAVSAFGFGGTNAHIIVAETPSDPPAADRANDHDRIEHEWPDRVGTDHEPDGRRRDATAARIPVVPWVISARDRNALRAQADRLYEWCSAAPEHAAVDIGWSLVTTRAVFEHRAVLLGGDRTELLDQADVLRGGATALEGASDAGGPPEPDESPEICGVTGVSRNPGRPVFVFPGQGGQWAGMGLELLESSPVFAAAMADCERALAPWVDWSLTGVLRGDPDAPPGDRTDVLQPALFAVMVSLARLWISHGVVPGAVIGHSQGEIAAAHVAGALSLDDAARIVAVRSRLMMRGEGHGGMLSVLYPAEEVARRLTRFGDDLSLAAINAPMAVTVSGARAALDEVADELTALGARVRPVRGARGAGHSPQVDALRTEIVSALATISPKSSETAFFSTVTGAAAPTSGLDAEYWFRNARHTVLFAPAVQAALAQGHRAFLEIGPHPVLSPALDALAAESGDIVIGTSLRRDDGGLRQFYRSAAELFVAGVDVDWANVFGEVAGRRVDLPTYPFQRRRYWLPDGAVGATGPPPSAAPAAPDADTPTNARPHLVATLTGQSAAEQERELLDVIRTRTAAVLGHESHTAVAPTRPFLEMGFDSLMAMQLRTQLAAAVGLDLSVAVVFRYRSPQELARHLRTVLFESIPVESVPVESVPVGSGTDVPAATSDPSAPNHPAPEHSSAAAHDGGAAVPDADALVRIAGERPVFTATDGSGASTSAETPTDLPKPLRLAAGSRLPILVCLSPFVAHAGPHQYARFAAPFRDRRTVWVVPNPGFAAGEPLPASWDDLVRVQARAVLDCAGDEPFAVLGFSSGGWLAESVAAHLDEVGRRPQAVVLLDSFARTIEFDDVALTALAQWQSTRQELPDGPDLATTAWYVRAFDTASPPPTVTPRLLLRARDRPAELPLAPPPDIDHTIEIPGDHFALITEHATRAAAAVESWLPH